MASLWKILAGLAVWSLLSMFAEAGDKRIWLKDGKAVVAESAPENVKKLVAAANRLVGKPYKWGGGHGEFDDDGYDCSGAASYVLREGGFLEGVRTSSGFLDFGEKGEGEWVTVWARSGHVFVTVAGLRFDTLGQDYQAGPQWYEKSRSKEKFVPRRVRKP